jgi:hypothetical protein
MTEARHTSSATRFRAIRDALGHLEAELDQAEHLLERSGMESLAAALDEIDEATRYPAATPDGQWVAKLGDIARRALGRPEVMS